MADGCMIGTTATDCSFNGRFRDRHRSCDKELREVEDNMARSGEHQSPIHAAVMDCIERYSKGDISMNGLGDYVKSRCTFGCSKESRAIVEMTVLHLVKILEKQAPKDHSTYSSSA